MKVQVLQENFKNALITANRFVSFRSQLPVLSNILLEAKSNKLIVSSTNLENSVSVTLGSKTKVEGSITLPSKVIVDLVSNLRPGAIDIEEEKERVSIKSANFKSVIAGMNAGDFPSIPQSVGKDPQRIQVKDVISSLNKVLFCVSNDETRPVLTGVLFIISGKGASLVATDGFRLSKTNLDIKGKDMKFIVPRSVLNDLVKLAVSTEKIDFSYKEGDGQVVFSFNDTVLASRLIEGDFPDFEKIIPKQSLYKVELDKDEFMQSVKLASVFARDSANVIKLIVKKDSILITSESKQSGSQEAVVEAKVTGEKTDLEIAFNYKYLEDFLNSVEGETVKMELSSANAPCIFLDPSEENYLHLIMPVKLAS